MTFHARRVELTGQVQAGELRSLPGRSVWVRPLIMLATMLSVLEVVRPELLSAPQTQLLAAVAILIFGLPHGSLDIALLQRQTQWQAQRSLIAIYLVIAAVMGAVWLVSPGLALATFFVLSILHFAEDWHAHLPPVPAHFVASAVLTAPMLAHPQAVTGIMVTLAGEPSATVIGNILLLVAPVALAGSAAAIAMLWTARQHKEAVATGAILLAMVVLPPAVAFALFFCVYHSPRQLAQTRGALGFTRWREGAGTIIVLTLVSLGFAVAILVILPAPTLSDATSSAAFITLSILTLPHMIAPAVAKRLIAAR